MVTKPWVNLGTCHTVFTMGKLIVVISCPQEGGWNKSSKYSKPCANMPSMIAGASGGASLMTAANNRQQAILPKLTQLTKINNKIKLQSKCNILNYFQRVLHVTSFLSPFLFSCFVILLCPLPSRGFNNSRVAGRCTRL